MLEWYMHGTLDDMRSFSIELLNSLEIDIKTYTFDNFDLNLEWKRRYKQPFECNLEELKTLAKNSNRLFGKKSF